MLAKNYAESYNRRSRAQTIIVEMQNGLRPEVNPGLCHRMAASPTAAPHAFLLRAS